MSMLVSVVFYIRSYIYLFEYVRKHPLTMSEYASQGKILHSTETGGVIMNATFHKEISVAKFQVGISRYSMGYEVTANLSQDQGQVTKIYILKRDHLEFMITYVCMCVPCLLYVRFCTASSSHFLSV